MPIRLVPTVVFRAPLLPMGALAARSNPLLRAPLGRAAIALASESLHASLTAGGSPDGAAQAALERYRRRAAFRPTPSGLLAGVGLGSLGPRTRLRSGEAQGTFRPSWARLSVLGRALLDDPDIRPFVSLRIAPSVLLGPLGASWLAFGEADEGLIVRSAELDPPLLAVLQAAEDWVSWPALVAAVEVPLEASGADDGAEAGTQLLLLLVEQGLLHHDLEPPLIGDPPLGWMRERLARFPAACDPILAPVRATLGSFDGEPALDAGVAAARQRLAELPGAGAGAGASPLAANLVFETQGPASFARAAFERAAALAPFLFRLQNALVPPLEERALDPALLASLDDLAEREGAGGFGFAALASGQHGRRLDETDGEFEPPPVPAGSLLAALVAELQAAAASGADEIHLDPDALAPLLPDQAVPATFEIFATPAPEPAGTPPGTGWLLGLHAPAGASLGRFVPALGEGLAAAIESLSALEAEAHPGVLSLDVAYAAAPAFADLACHPPGRPQALALTSWPQARSGVVVPADLRLVLDPASPEPRALAWGDSAVRPAPLERVRSTTAPPGLWRLLAGWSFCRQHAPWAFSWGPLADLPVLPRVVLGGFVIAPRSWRVPEPEALVSPAALARWRRAAGVPRQVQVGSGDELLCLDLASAGAAAELARFARGRVHEIWPPLGATVDRDGRRIEVVALAAEVPDEPARAERARRAAAVAATAVVAPPGPRLADSRWTTFRIHGLEESQDAVLFEAIAPTVAWARGPSERTRASSKATSSTAGAAPIDRWFFLRYRDPATGRPHLRLRVRRSPGTTGSAFELRLRAALHDRMLSGDVTEVETAGYLPETARYRGPEAMAAVEVVFEAGSQLVLDRLALEDAGLLDEEDSRLVFFVRTADALVEALGLDAGDRLRLAERRRQTLATLIGGEDLEIARAFRSDGRALVARLRGGLADRGDPATEALGRYHQRLTRLVESVAPPTRERLGQALADLLHVEAVRLLGPERTLEQAGYVFWAKARKSLLRSSR